VHPQHPFGAHHFSCKFEVQLIDITSPSQLTKSATNNKNKNRRRKLRNSNDIRKTKNSINATGLTANINYINRDNKNFKIQGRQYKHVEHEQTSKEQSQ
jgi:hypothetical protein